MKREQIQLTGTARQSTTLETHADGRAEVSARQFKRVQRCVAPATPATWSRYIDSRLRQFCTR